MKLAFPFRLRNIRIRDTVINISVILTDNCIVNSAGGCHFKVGGPS